MWCKPKLLDWGKYYEVGHFYEIEDNNFLVSIFLYMKGKLYIADQTIESNTFDF